MAFFQPPLTQEPALSKSYEAVGVQFADVQHEVKLTRAALSAEDWIYQLLSGQDRPYVKDNVSGSRWGLTGLLVGNGITVSSEIRTLSESYATLAASPGILSDFPKTRTALPRDHVLWLDRYSPDGASLPPVALPWPWIEAPRAVRLVVQEDGRIAARQMTIAKPRVDTKSVKGLIRDPHVPVTADGVFRRLMGRTWDYRFLHACLYGGAEGKTNAPQILQHPEADWVRVCSIGTDQGKTKGYREKLVRYRRPGRRGAVLDPMRKRMSALSYEFLARAAAVQRYALFPAAMCMQGPTPSEAWASLITQRFQDRLEDPSLALIIDLSDQDDDPARDLHAINRLVLDTAREALEHAEGQAPCSLFRWTSIASGWRLFHGALRFHASLKGFDLMSAFDSPDRPTTGTDDDPSGTTEADAAGKRAFHGPELARETYGWLSRCATAIRHSDTLEATLRTMPTGGWNLAFWRLLSQAPNAWIEDERARVALGRIAMDLGHLSHDHKAPDFGRALADVDVPEERVNRLLEASGDALHALVGEAMAFVASRFVPAINWGDAAGLLLSDALNRPDVADWHRRRIAVDYCRASDARRATVTKGTTKGAAAKAA